MPEDESLDIARELDESNPTIIKSFVRRLIPNNHFSALLIREQADVMAKLYYAIAIDTPPEESNLLEAYENFRLLLRATTLTELKNFCDAKGLTFLTEQEQQLAKTAAMEQMGNPIRDILDSKD